MALRTSLAGRVRNTSLPKSHALLPLMEAVVNGIQAVDARPGGDAEPGRVSVTVHRDGQAELDFGPTGPGRAPMKPILGFTIEDNGVGFTPENMASFETLDSDYKASIGGRGVGRLLWLKAFDKVSIRSAYEDVDGDLCGRQFRFSIEREVEHDGDPAGFTGTGAVVSLDGFKNAFQQNAPKGVDVIAREIFEHCVWYFLRPGGAPAVTIADDDDSVSLEDLMHEFVYSELPQTTIEVKGEKFDMVNLCLKSSTRNAVPRLHWCAASRVVSEENLTGKVPGLYGRLKDEAYAEFTYVCWRTILDLLARLIRSDEDGKYSREDRIHSLLIPMRKDSNEIGTDASNLWIIDERLAFHDYLASDKTLKSMPITGSESTKEPDILATRLVVDSPMLAAEGERLPLPSIVVVEIKRPMRKDAREDKNPIQQCLDYVKRVRAGGVMTASGRPIPPTQESPAFCYIVADLTEKMIERCEVSNLRPTHDGLGYFGFNDSAKAYIEVLSFDQLVNAATERNKAFFDKLGLPSA